MSKQALDISQMQHLEALGVDTSNASACWFRVLGFDDLRVFTLWSLAFNKYIAKHEGLDTQIVSTFTLQDILDLLPSEIQKDGKVSTLDILKHTQNYIMCFWSGEPLFRCENKELIDAAYEMLCLCIKEGFVKNK